MKRGWKTTSSLMAGTVFVVVMVLISVPISAQPTGGPARPLTSASQAEVAQVAIQYTQTNFKVLSGTPQILRTLAVTKADLPLLGLSAIDFSGEDPPLMLVALKGNFDVSHMGRSGGGPWQVHYIVYVFDLKAGIPTLIEVSPRGGRFRRLLNDPGLPEDTSPGQTDRDEHIVPNIQNAPLQALPVSPAKKVPYGATVPGIGAPVGPLPQVEK